VKKGGECSTGAEFEREQLLALGNLLRNSGKNDLGFNEENMGKRRVENPVRICALNDLAFRFMDKSKVQGKRWFYRALEAKLQGHPLK
jgi:hypothetical protein